MFDANTIVFDAAYYHSRTCIMNMSGYSNVPTGVAPLFIFYSEVLPCSNQMILIVKMLANYSRA